jgi:hypothetical protein
MFVSKILRYFAQTVSNFETIFPELFLYRFSIQYVIYVPNFINFDMFEIFDTICKSLNPVVPNLFWVAEHLRPGKVLAEHFRPKKSLTEHLSPKQIAFLDKFQNFKKIGGKLGTCLRNTSVLRNSGRQPLM